MNPRVVIVGAGFGGLLTARGLKGVPVDITLIDRNNFHLFQPLLYQVATAGLSPAQIATPIRSILRKQKNAEVMMTEVTGIDTAKRQVLLGNEPSIPYDYLVLATGATHSYFGHEEWVEFAPGLKSVTDATWLRRKILSAFELAEMEPNEEIRKELLRFVIVGGGPTGVELAGSIAELAHRTIRSDFRKVDPRHTEIILIEAGPRILAGFPESLAEKAKTALERMGVVVKTNARVQKINRDCAQLPDERIPTRSVIWAAGVTASPAGKWLGAEIDRAGRVKVNPDLSVPGHPNIFVIGDTCTLLQDGKPLPGVAPVAMQMGRYIASCIKMRARDSKHKIPPFHYFNKGNLATIGRSYAIADLGKLKLSGLLGWSVWVVVHIAYLIGFRNRLLVLIEWAWAYFTYQRGARLITPVDRGEA